MQATILLLALTISQPQAPPVKELPPQAPAITSTIPQAPPIKSEYAAATKRAVDMNLPIVIFNRVEKRLVAGAVAVAPDDLYDGTFIGVGLPDGRGWFQQMVRLSAGATDAEIARALRGGEPLADPFDKRFKRTVGKRAQRDDDLEGYGPWPMALAKIDGLKRYVPSRFTQEIATTNNRPRISSVPRDNLEAKWHQSGGMEGIEGWRSDLYKSVETKPYTARLPVLNSFGYIQHELGWTRNYPDGAIFLDVLSKDGEVFEVRQAKKESGAWTRKAIYRNEDAYPKGYAGLKQSCSSCHDDAGSGGYATGLVPGADTIISDPIYELERQ